jgi:alpha-beta hydrolase superfamily lysophospholipase
VTKEPATDLFAPRFQEAGYAVLAFDYRHLGESGGEPRQVARVEDQLADWRAAMSSPRRCPVSRRLLCGRSPCPVGTSFSSLRSILESPQR